MEILKKTQVAFHKNTDRPTYCDHFQIKNKCFPIVAFI